MAHATASETERPGVGRVAFAGLVGTTSQYFGFFSYALAAVLVFPSAFFPAANGATAPLTTFASIGVAFVVRPLGALVFGHFGDRSGRTAVLVWSLLTMGAATFSIGLLPEYAEIGVAAPVLLVLLRMTQGAALGGEGMGAVVLAVEHAPPRRRGLYSAFPGAGASLGALLANGVFLLLSMGMPPDQFRAWGWRVPFLASCVLAGVAVFVRVSIAETPAFKAAVRREEKVRVPLADVVRRKPRVLMLATSALVVGNVLYFVTQTFALSYGTTVLDVPDRIMLHATLVSIAVQAVVGFASAMFSDRLGRRRVCMAGALLCAMWAFPLIWLLQTRSPWLITVGFSVSMLVYAIYSGPLSAYLAGMFETRIRFTAVALVFNTGVMVGGALAPTISDRLVALTGSVWAVPGFVIATAVLSLFSLWRLFEPYPEGLGPEAEEEAQSAPAHLRTTSGRDRTGVSPSVVRSLSPNISRSLTKGIAMGAETSDRTTAPSAVQQVTCMGTLFTPWAIRVAVTLRIPDMIAQGVTEPGSLAECTRTDTHALLRLLRHLANLGLLRSQGASGFGLTALGRVLCHDHPAGVAGFYDQGDAWARAGDQVIPGLLHSVRTGRPAWEHVHGKPFWEALAADQELAGAFDRAMSVHVSDIGPWLAANRDWATVRHVVDVGGGTGKLLAALLHGHAHLRGTVVEQAETAARASALFAEEGLSQRATALSGSFFDALPPGGDVYLLAHILHDWPDEDAVALLRRCADALDGRGWIFVVDRIRAESGNTESADTAAQLAVSQRDMAMLVVLGGVERTKEEFQQVGTRAGLRLVSAVPTEEKGLFLMEFTPER